MALTASSVPTLWRLARLSFDPVRQQRVLLYPEGAVLLNETGAAILELCDGHHSIATIVQMLGERYHYDVMADVTDYLSQFAEKELIRDG